MPDDVYSPDTDEVLSDVPAAIKRQRDEEMRRQDEFIRRRNMGSPGFEDAQQQAQTYLQNLAANVRSPQPSGPAPMTPGGLFSGTDPNNPFIMHAMPTQQAPQQGPPSQYRQLADAAQPLVGNQIANVLNTPRQHAQIDNYGGMTAHGGALGPDAILQQMTAARPEDKDDPMDKLIQGALTPAMKNPYYDQNVALAHYLGADPNKLIDKDGNVHLTKGQSAKMMLRELLSGVANGPRYVPLQQRLQTEAKLLQDNRLANIKAAQASQRADNADARTSELQRQNDIRNMMTARHQLVQQAISQGNFDQKNYDKDLVSEINKARLMTQYEAELRHWDAGTAQQAFNQKRIDLAEQKLKDGTAGGWDGMARQLANEEYTQENPGVDPRSDPEGFKALYVKNLRDIAQARHIQTDPTRWITIRGGNDDAGNPIINALPINQREGPGQPIAIPLGGKTAQQMKDIKTLDTANEQSARVLGSLSDIGISGQADSITGALNGNQLVSAIRNQTGNTSLNEKDLDLATYEENIANVKKISPRVTNFELQMVKRALPQKIDNWHTALRASSLMATYNQFAAFRAHAGFTTHEAEEALTKELKIAADAYVHQTEKMHDSYMTAKRIDPSTPPPPSPKMATPRQILSNLAKQGYVLKDNNLVYVGKDKAQENND